jgi:CheY-like chemotaxis protein
MKWNNAIRDHLPSASQKVLVSIKGVYYSAYYDCERQRFAIEDEAGKIELTPATDQMYWKELTIHKQIGNREFFRILIADDDRDDQEMMKEAFRKCKADVRIDVVFDGVQAIDFLLKRKPYNDITYLPDLVILDINLPVKNGFCVLKEIKEHPVLEALPVYIVTTSRTPEDMKSALELGARGFYSKGSSSMEIYGMVSELCRECLEEVSV